MSASRVIKKAAKAPRPLGVLVKDALERYFEDLNGQPPADLYELVMAQIEQPLLKVVMRETRGNISKAALLLGINRATLRKKLRKYRLVD